MHSAIMIDFETLSLHYDAVLTQLAAVHFDLDADKFSVLDKKEIRPCLSYQDHRHVSLRSIKWHMEHGGTEINLDPYSSGSFNNTMRDFTNFIIDHKPDTVWSKGADFDIAIIKHYIEKEGGDGKLPWDYRSVRCFRTLTCLFPEVKRPPTEGIQFHIGINDAVYQAEWCWNIHKHLRQIKQSWDENNASQMA